MIKLSSLGPVVLAATLFAFSSQAQSLDGTFQQKSVQQLKSILLVDGNNQREIDSQEVQETEHQEWVEDSFDSYSQASFYADDFGVAVYEAEQRLKVQNKLGKVLELLENINRERFAGAWIENTPKYRAVVRLTGKEPVAKWMTSIVVDGFVPVSIITGADTTLAELVKSVDASVSELKTVLPELSGTEVDVKTGEIVLTVEGDSATEYSLQSLQSLFSKTRSAQMEKFLSLPIRFEQVDTPASDFHTRGGAHLSSCTSGFVVKNGAKGYITSGHCPNSQTYYEYGGTNYSTTFIDEIRDADQDVQWHTTPHDEYPHFYASSSSSYRTLTSKTERSSQSVGGYVCHRGKSTGYSCGDIDSKTYKPTYSNACNGVTCSSVWIKVSGSSLKCYGGDSGGPWFLVYSAYGIMKGGSSSGTSASDCNYAIYMSSTYFGIPLLF